jgi:two-component system, sensor histidine kinase and response regulator
MIRILVIEDEALVRDNLVELLQAEGYATLEARNGEEGVRVARDTLPDLILCDIRMPRLDGFGVLARLSQDPLTSVLPFIFLTARTEKADQRIGMGMGADDYITKPFTRHDLLTSVRRRLEKRSVLAEQTEQKLQQLNTRIQHSLPYELLAPLSVMLGYSETLMKAEWVNSDSSQVRAVARELNRAADRLAHLVQNYLFFFDLESQINDPKRQAQLKNEKFEHCDMILKDLAKGIAHEFDRMDDLVLNIQPAVLNVSELFFQTVVEEIIDRAFRQSRPGSPIEISGQISVNGMYRMVFHDQGGRIPQHPYMREGPHGSIEEIPPGLLLARRIIEIYKGRFQVNGTSEDGNLVEIELPGSAV